MDANDIPVIDISKPGQETGDQLVDAVHTWGFAAFNFGEFELGKAEQPVPEAFVAHEVDISEFAQRCRALCIQLLRLFASGLKIDHAEGGQDWFAERHNASKGPSGSILRLLHVRNLKGSFAAREAHGL
ncbi:MAG: hypothetical protein Q9170_005767 [Blastenia crenularia]